MKFSALLKWFFLMCLVYAGQASAQDKPVQLKDVQINAVKKALKETARGSTLDLTKLKEAKFWNLAEALKQIPGIEVDEATNKITYMGKEVAILRDGVAVAGFENQILNTLNSSTAITYDKIELNLLDLKTEKPTLSFVAPNYTRGYFGNISSAAGTNNSSLYPSVSLSGKKHLLNFTPAVSFMYSPISESNWQTDYDVSGLKELRKNEQDRNKVSTASIGLSDSYFMAKGHTLNASVNYVWNRASYVMNSSNRRFRDGLLLGSSEIRVEDKAVPSLNNHLKANLGYVYKLKPIANVTRRLDIAVEFEDKQSNALQRSAALAGDFFSNSIYESLNTGRDKGVFALAGYEYQHQKIGTFESVVKYFNRKQYKTYTYHYQVDAQGADSLIWQDNAIMYQYGAFLLSWDKAFKAFSARIVLKQDYSNDNIKNDRGKNRVSFTTFSPYLSLLRNTKVGSLRFEAQYLERRPELSSMSSVINYGGQYSISGMQTIGNPDLKPAKILDFSATCNTTVRNVNLIATARFVNTTDAISQYRMVVDSTIVQTYRNLSASKMYKGDVSFNFYLFPRFTAQLVSNASFVNYHIDENTLKKTLLWTEGLNFGYTPSPNLRLKAGLNYMGGSTFQSKIPARFNSNFTGTYTAGPFNFTIMVNNFHQPYFTIENEISGDGYQMQVFSRSRRITSNLNISYRFGKVSGNTTAAKSIIRDDM